MSEKKSSRNRSLEKKKERMEKIVDKGTELFLKDGQNMSLRNLARELNITVSGLYKYVDNKRELWFACQNRAFDQLAKEWDKMEGEHKGNNLELVGKFGKAFLELSLRNFPLFKFMFLHDPPKANSEKPGPNELKCNRGGFTNLFKTVSQAVNSGELNTPNSMYFSLALWGFVLGPAIITSPIQAGFFEGLESEEFNKMEFHKYVYSLILKMFK